MKKAHEVPGVRIGGRFAGSVYPLSRRLVYPLIPSALMLEKEVELLRRSSP